MTQGTAPPTPKQSTPPFRGWKIVGVAAAANLTHQSGNNTVLSIFMKSMETEFGASRAIISGVSTVARLIEAFAAPLVGPLLDRGWHKRLMVGGALLAGLGFMLLGLADNLWQIYLLKGLVVGLGLAGFGQLVTAVTLSNWFIAKRGRAMGIAALGGSGGSLILVPSATWILSNYGWRWGWVFFGVLIWVVVVIPAALFVNRRPEDIGQLPDGRRPEDAATTAKGTKAHEAPAEAGWTRSLAMRTRTFWLLTLAMGIAQMAFQALNLHLFPYLLDQGYTVGVVASIITARGVLALVCNPGWGFVADRFDVRYLLTLNFLIYGVGIFVLLQVSTLSGVLVAVAIYSVAIAGMNVIVEVAWARYYGRQSLGSIRGASLPLGVLFSAGGPTIAGILYSIQGSYVMAFWGIIVSVVMSAGLAMLCTRPKLPATVNAL